MYKFIIGLIPNDWKDLLRNGTSQKSLLEFFCYSNKVTRKVKDFQNLCDIEIYLSLQSNSAKYNKLSFQIHFMDKLPSRTLYSQS